MSALKHEICQRAYDFATRAHGEQKRKYTGEPYVTHCLAVAELVAQYVDDPEVIAAALLHDTLEDTDATEALLLAQFGQRVTDLVLEVTDVSKPSDGIRAVRKAMDREHLSHSSPEGASIKLADLIHNTASIVQHDTGFERVYLREKKALLPVLEHGNPALLALARKTLANAQEKLGGA